MFALFPHRSVQPCRSEEVIFVLQRVRQLRSSLKFQPRCGLRPTQRVKRVCLPSWIPFLGLFKKAPKGTPPFGGRPSKTTTINQSSPNRHRIPCIACIARPNLAVSSPFSQPSIRSRCRPVGDASSPAKRTGKSLGTGILQIGSDPKLKTISLGKSPVAVGGCLRFPLLPGGCLPSPNFCTFEGGGHKEQGIKPCGNPTSPQIPNV